MGTLRLFHYRIAAVDLSGAHIFSAAAFTLEAAQVEAARYVAQFDTHTFFVAPGRVATRKHRAIFVYSCPRCLCRGIEPKCKRKPCVECTGCGTLPIYSMEVAPPSVQSEAVL